MQDHFFFAVYMVKAIKLVNTITQWSVKMFLHTVVLSRCYSPMKEYLTVVLIFFLWKKMGRCWGKTASDLLLNGIWAIYSFLLSLYLKLISCRFWRDGANICSCFKYGICSFVNPLIVQGCSCLLCLWNVSYELPRSLVLLFMVVQTVNRATWPRAGMLLTIALPLLYLGGFTEFSCHPEASCEWFLPRVEQFIPCV